MAFALVMPIDRTEIVRMRAAGKAGKRQPYTAVQQGVVNIVCKYVSYNSISTTELPLFIATIHIHLANLAMQAQVSQAADGLLSAMQIRRSISWDYIVCFEDGKRFKALRRHLKTAYAMTPAQYCAKWGLPADYPMVAPSHAATRSANAKKMGLGRFARPPKADL